MNLVSRMNSGGKGPGAIFGEEDMEQFRKYYKHDQCLTIRSGKSPLRKLRDFAQVFNPPELLPKL